MSRGKIIVIVAPSGTGKSTLIKLIHQDFPQLQESISTTTRSPREGEEHGKHYFFESVDNFKKMINEDAFLEWAKVHSNYYGTSKAFVEQQLSQGHSLIFDIDVQGADSFQCHFGEQACIIFIEPPSIEELRARLVRRATDPLDVIEERVGNAAKELERKSDYSHCVMNDKVENAREKLHRIISIELEGN